MSHFGLAANASREAAQRGHYADPGLGGARGGEAHEERRDEEPVIVVVVPDTNTNTHTDRSARPPGNHVSWILTRTIMGARSSSRPRMINA